MARPKTHDDALRVKLLDRAGELLADEGPEGLNLRRLAAEVGTSTTAVYSLFGSKPALLRQLCAEGLRRIGDQLRSVEPGPDPVSDLVRLGLAYRDAALAQRHLYPLLFDGSIPGFGGVTAEAASAALDPLREAARTGIDAGVFPTGNADTIATAVWAYTHGMVSFELKHLLPAGFAGHRGYERGLRAAVSGWCGE